MDYETLLHETDADEVATITLNRPERLNHDRPAAAGRARGRCPRRGRGRRRQGDRPAGAGRSFCAGFDFGGGFHHRDEHLTTNGEWDSGKDFVFATAPSLGPVPKSMSIWRSPKP